MPAPLLSSGIAVLLCATPGSAGTKAVGACCLPSGACCFPDGHCEVLWADTCQALGGLWQGSPVPCLPNPCAVSDAPGEEYRIDTWGRVKRSYR